MQVTLNTIDFGTLVFLVGVLSGIIFGYIAGQISLFIRTPNKDMS